MLCVSPYVFAVILELIKKHKVFRNNSNVPQSPVDFQLAVMMFCMGWFGNASSLIGVAQQDQLKNSWTVAPQPLSLFMISLYAL